jgi:hypothetical protein
MNISSFLFISWLTKVRVSIILILLMEDEGISQTLSLVVRYNSEGEGYE